MNDFPYSLKDVLDLCHISYPTGNSVRIRCPFCQQAKINKDFKIDFSTESFGCFRCGITSRYGVNFYALYYNLNTKEAHKIIMQQLGLNENARTFRTPPRKMAAPQICEESERASIEIIDRTYRKMQECLHLSKENEEDLMSRGFTSDEILGLGYVSYPKSNTDAITPEYFEIPRLLMDNSCTLKGVPGFFKTKNKGIWSLCKRKGGILVPYVDFHNRIQGFQLRKNNQELDYDTETGEMEYKYCWISSAGLKDGCKAAAKIHYAVDFKWDTESKSFIPSIKGNKIMLTEGAMKGDLAHSISGIPFICVPGVSSAKEALLENIPLLKSIGIDTIVIAYDMDRVMNVHVLKALISMKELIEENGMKCINTSWSNKVMNIDGSIEVMDVANTFVFTTEMMSSMTSEKMNKILDDILPYHLTVLFAMQNSADVSQKSHAFFASLKEACKKRNLPIKTVFWSLKLKGIDDYYAYHKRGIKYV